MSNYKIAEVTAHITAAREKVRYVFGIGLAAVVAGVTIAVNLWPATPAGGFTWDAAGTDKSDTGNIAVALIGVGVAATGQILLVVALIAWGVRLGIESAWRSSTD